MTDPGWQPRLVILDFDGTLADSFPWFSRILNSLADKHDFRRVEPGEVDHLRGLSARQIIKHLQISAWKFPRIARDLRQLATRDIGQLPLFAGVEAVLARLARAGLQLAVVSSNSEENVRAVLGRAAAASIAVYECGASVFGKRRRLRRVLSRTGIAADHTLVIGDEIRDLEAARAEGLRFGAVSWGYTTPAALAAHRPDLVFETVADIGARLVPAAGVQ
jgi:phosphoglycolate phosphatase